MRCAFVCACVIQRITIEELEKNADRVQELEDQVTDLTQRLEEAESLTPDGAAKRIRSLEKWVLTTGFFSLRPKTDALNPCAQ